MKRQTGLYIFIVTILILTGGFSWNVYLRDYMNQDVVDIHTFPMTIHGWDAEEVPIPERSYEILETRNVFVRNFKNLDGQEIQLFIVYAEDNRKVSHPPEVCYAGGGFSVVNKSDVVITGNGKYFPLKVNRLLLDFNNQDYISLYWFKAGDVFTRVYWKQQILTAWNKFCNRPTSSALIRVSGAVRDYQQDPQKTEKMLMAFTKLILPEIVQHLP